MSAFTRFAQLEYRATRNDFATVRTGSIPASASSSATSADRRPARPCSYRTCLAVASCLYRLFSTTSGTSARFNSITTRIPGFIGFVANIGNAVELFVTHQFCNAFQQRLLINLIWQLVDDNRRTDFPYRILQNGFLARITTRPRPVRDKPSRTPETP